MCADRSALSPAIRSVAAELLAELEAHRLVVIKFRTTHEGDETWRRAAISSNPRWYSRLCRREEKSRRRYPKPRTVVRRPHTLTALRRIVAGTADPASLYVRRLMPFIRERIEQEVPC